ncbi:hypothetical protein LCGC14_0754690 [marine sediment metagenome]|uniref:Transglycosylase SLT domain-containing protein n=1 Tax=marine sediment metagenome TaxID=412755 RepID=A0A0F9Q797_9ZZZZ
MAVREIVHVRGLEKTSPSDRRSIVRTADRLGVSPSDLAAAISFETAGSFDPAQPNLGGGSAVGLIQFMPSTARLLGTTSAELRAMTFQEQMVYVEQYLSRVARSMGKLRNLSDVYLAIFAPVGVGKSPGARLPYKGRQYEANKHLDRAGKGYITVADAARPATNILAAGLKRPRILVEMDVDDVTIDDVGEVLTPVIDTAKRKTRNMLKVAAGALALYAGSRVIQRRRQDDGKKKK